MGVEFGVVVGGVDIRFGFVRCVVLVLCCVWIVDGVCVKGWWVFVFLKLWISELVYEWKRMCDFYLVWFVLKLKFIGNLSCSGG